MGTIVSILGTIVSILLLFVFVVLLFLAAVLFFPIRYRFFGSYQEKLQAKAQISWFFHLISFRMQYEEESSVVFKICGIDVFRLLERRKEKRKRKQQKAAKKRKKNQTRTKEEKKDVKEQERKENLSVTERQENKSQRKKKTFFTIWKSRWKKICDFFKGFYRIIKKICQKVSWLQEAKAFWKSENTQNMVCILKDNMIHLWRKLKPKRLWADICFGTGQPDTTGQILGLLAVFYAYYGEAFHIMPDFEQAKLEGQIWMKGQISLITIVGIFIRILISKEWKRFRHEAEELKEAF